jgi:bifunctional non-homologous end joining protein LigD
MPELVEFQLCQLVDKPPVGPAWIHEIKYDGYRMQLRMEDGRATWRTRNLHDWTAKFGRLNEAVEDLPDGIYDGELCAVRPDGTPDFGAVRSAMGRGDTASLVFFVFDAPWLDGEDLRSLPLKDRKTRLEARLTEIRLPRAVRLVDAHQGPGEPMLQAACRMGLEGIVSKRLDAPYRPGKNGCWTKAKCRPQLEVVIGGYTTKGSRFTGLLSGVWQGDKFVYSGSIGTGFSEKCLRELLPQLRAVEAATSPFHQGAPRKTPDIHWLRPELVANVETAELTNSGKLRQASFKGLRDDKDPRQVVLEWPGRRQGD